MQSKISEGGLEAISARLEMGGKTRKKIFFHTTEFLAILEKNFFFFFGL